MTTVKKQAAATAKTKKTAATKKSGATEKAKSSKTTAVKKTTVKKATAKKTAEKKTAEKKVAEKKKAVKKATAKKPSYTEAVKAAGTVLFNLRALDLTLLNLQGITDTSDFMILATCESEAQMQAILDALSKEFKALGISSRTEYKPGINMRWAVFDAGFDLMVHLFEEGKREELAIDRLYGDAVITKLEEKDFIQTKTKKTKAKNELI
jgi:ribosome silencing factor RsfS/YbeB/iojap